MQREIIKDKSLLVQRFESFEEFVEQIKKPRHPNSDRDGFTSSSRPDDAGDYWYQSRDYDHALELAEKGWPEGLAKMETIRANLKSYAGDVEERHETFLSESGDEPDIGRFLEGDPENMVEFKPVYIPSCGRVIKLVLNCSASAGVGSDQMFRRGAAAVMLCDAIERAGLRSEIVLTSFASGSHKWCSADYITIKRADQHVELDRLAFMLAHPSVFRRFIFRLWEQEEDFRKHHVGHGYGLVREWLPYIDGPLSDDTVYIGGMHLNNFRTPEDTTRFINSIMEKYTEPEPQIA